MTDLDDRFEAYVFAPKRERIVQKWRVIQCQFVTLFSGNGISGIISASFPRKDSRAGNMFLFGTPPPFSK